MLVFDGVDDYVTIADHDDLDFGAEESYTLMAVARPNLVTFNEVLVSKAAGAGPTSVGYMMYIHSLAVYALQVDGTNQRFDINTGGTAVQTLLVTTSRRNAVTNEIEAFIDGVGTGSPAVDAGLTLANSLDFVIGQGGGNYLNGEIMAVALWRRALTDTEVGAAGVELATWYRQPGFLIIG
jgi:hypothetical protein